MMPHDLVPDREELDRVFIRRPDDLTPQPAPRDRLFVPGLRAVGGLPTAPALAAPAPTFIHNAAGKFPVPDISRLYNTLGCPDALADQAGEATTGAIVEWLSRTLG